MELARKKEPAGSSLKDGTKSQGLSTLRTEHRTFYDIRQWAAETDPNVSVDFVDHGCSKFACDTSMPTGHLPIPEKFSVSSATVSDVSFPAYNGLQRNNLSAAGAGMELGLDLQDQAFDNGLDYPGPEYQSGPWPFPPASAEDMEFSNSAASYPTVSSDSNVDPGLPDWSVNPLQNGGIALRTVFPSSSQCLAWSPISAADPSVSSSYSQGSYLAMQSGNGLSPNNGEYCWATELNGIPDEFYPAFSLGESLQAPASTSGFVQDDAMRHTWGLLALKPPIQDARVKVRLIPMPENIPCTRVHDFTGPASSSGSISPPPSVNSFAQGQATLAIRKRGPSSPAQLEAPRKTRATTNPKPVAKTGKTAAPAASAKQRQAMQKVWQQQKAAISARMEILDPDDTHALEQIRTDYLALDAMAMNIRRQGAPQLAN
ncbi:MAG: hypothetical protein LQ342_002072 [Letrouitia transgressa]|nr:MAG: hypothetical protein LQ342_002072 [Letrouitia transgressa]